MTDGVHASIQAEQAPLSRPGVDAVIAKTERPQLRPADHAMLPPQQYGQPPLEGRFLST